MIKDNGIVDVSHALPFRTLVALSLTTCLACGTGSAIQSGINNVRRKHQIFLERVCKCRHLDRVSSPLNEAW